MRNAALAAVAIVLAFALAACGGDPGGNGGSIDASSGVDSAVGMGRISDVAYCAFAPQVQRCEDDPDQCWNATHDCAFPALACGGRMWTCYADYPDGYANCCNDTFYVCPWKHYYCPATGACFPWERDFDPPMDQICPSILDCTFTGAECVTL